MEGSQRAPHTARMLPQSYRGASTLTPAIRESYTNFQGNYVWIPHCVRRSNQNHGSHICLADNAQPFCVNTPRAVPSAYRDKLKAELDLLQSQGVISPVTKPTEWCVPIVITPKKDSEDIRMCVNLSRLNKYVRCKRYQSSTPAQAIADIAADNTKSFTKLDAMNGYTPVFLGWRELTSNHIYHAFWPVQISTSSLWHILYLRALCKV